MQNNKGIVVLDIDGTILNVQDVEVGKIFPDGHEEWLNIHAYEKDPDINNPDITWDFSQFEDIDKLTQSITTADPLIGNLKIMDAKVAEGWDVCFLTARSYCTEQALYDALQNFLKINDGTGQLYPIGDVLKRDMCTAVGDSESQESPFSGINIAVRKGNVLKRICELYDQVLYIDDDINNISMAKGIALEYSNLQVFESLKESQLKEMRKLPELKGQISVVQIGIEENEIDCVIGFKDKKHWWYTYDKDITDNVEEAAVFESVSEAQSFIESITLGELPRQGIILHIVKFKDAISMNTI